MGLDKVAGNSNSRHCWGMAVAVSIVAVLLQIGGDPVREALAYTRDGVAAGEVWRLLTGHIVHLGWTHMWLNLAGLALVAWLVGGAFDWRRWLAVTGITATVMATGFWLLYPELDWYVGLSGLEHGLLVGGLYAGIRARDKESLILFAFVLAKLSWEQISGGPLPGSEATSGGAVIVDAHLYGTIGGAIAGALLRRRVEPATSI